MSVGSWVQCLPVLTEKAGEQGNEGHTDEGNAAARHELLHALALGSGIVISVAFEQIDHAPNTEAGTESNNESLENVNSRVKKIHR